MSDPGRYKPPKPFAICDKCNTVYPWAYTYCEGKSCENKDLRHEGDMPDLRIFTAKLDSASKLRYKI